MSTGSFAGSRRRASIRLPVDPQSEAAEVALFGELHVDRRPRARCPEGETLQHLLADYFHGSSPGRSVLVAGHRGSGKTALVWSVLQEVRGMALKAGQAGEFRPERIKLLPIKIDGPQLFIPNARLKSSDADTASRDADTATANPVLPFSVHGETVGMAHPPDGPRGSIRPMAAGSASTPPIPGGAPAREIRPPAGYRPDRDPDPEGTYSRAEFLKQLMSGIYLSLSREIAQSLRHFACDAAGLPAQRRRAVMEMAATIEYELDRPPRAEQIRTHWRRLGLLEHGVLFAREGRYWRHGRGTTSGPTGVGKDRPDQGLREILALTTARDAYLKVISEAYERSRKSSSSFTATLRTQQEEAGRSGSGNRDRLLGPSGRALLAAMAGLIAGIGSLDLGGIGGAVLGSGGSGGHFDLGITAGVAAVLAALAMLVGTQVVASRTAERRRDDFEQVRDDTSVETLSRDIPRIMTRLKDAGVLPVFVIDELDKLDAGNGAIRLEPTIKNFKNLMNTEGFFIFMTDRIFFEEIDRKIHESFYPTEQTYFQDRLFVCYRPVDLLAFLHEVIHV